MFERYFIDIQRRTIQNDESQQKSSNSVQRGRSQCRKEAPKRGKTPARSKSRKPNNRARSKSINQNGQHQDNGSSQGHQKKQRKVDPCVEHARSAGKKKQSKSQQQYQKQQNYSV